MTVTLAYLAFSETRSLVQLGGAALVLAAAVLLSVRGRPARVAGRRLGSVRRDGRARRGVPRPAGLRPAVGGLPRGPLRGDGRAAAARQPVFYAPSIDYHVVTRYADVEAVFADPDTFSAAAAQLPLVALEAEARRILLDGGHKPQPSMVSLDPPEHTRLRRPTARAFSAAPRRRDGAARAGDPRRAARRDRPGARRSTSSRRSPSRCRPPSCSRFIGVPPADYEQLKAWCGSRATSPGAGPRRRAGRARAQHDGLPALPARARGGEGAARAPTTSPARCWPSTTRTRTRSPTRRSPRSCSR